MYHIGIDLIRLSRINPLAGQWDDPFFQKTFTKKEHNFCLSTSNPIRSFTEAFAAKEAVFKALNIDASQIRLNQIEILRTETGRPSVTLLEPLLSQMSQKGIYSIDLSLSYDNDLVIAMAIAE